MDAPFAKRVSLADQVQRWRAFIAAAAKVGADPSGVDAAFHLGNARRRAVPFLFPVAHASAQNVAKALACVTEFWGEMRAEDREAQAGLVAEAARCADRLIDGPRLEAAIEHRRRILGED